MEDKTLKNIKMYVIGDKAILSIYEKTHYLVDLDSFLMTKDKFYETQDGIIVPFDSSFWFHSYKILDDKVLFHIDVASKENYLSLNGSIDKTGKVSNWFTMGECEIYLNDSLITNTNEIVVNCFDVVSKRYIDDQERYLFERKVLQ